MVQSLCGYVEHSLEFSAPENSSFFRGALSCNHLHVSECLGSDDDLMDKQNQDLSVGLF